MTASLHTLPNLFPAPQKPVQTQFEALWQLWPRRERKALAMAKYDAILRGMRTKTHDKDSGTFVEIDLAATEDEIIAGAEAYLLTQKATGSGSYGYKDGGKFIPYLCYWLNQGRWMDCT